MRTFAAPLGIHALVLALLLSRGASAEERSLTFLFGPAFAGNARQGASAAASTARHWFEKPGSTVQLRRAGNTDPQTVEPRANLKDLARIFATAADESRETDPSAFVDALTAAAQAAALRPGVKILVAVLNSPPLSSDAESELERLTQFCREHHVRVIVLDLAGASKADTASALKSLATSTGGMTIHNAKALELSVDMVLPKTAAVDAAAPFPKPAPPQDAAAAPSSPIPFEIPVHTRFIRTSTTGSAFTGTDAALGATDTKQSSTMLVERAFEANSATGPLRGLIMTEAPLNALKFETDDTAGTYTAKARITITVFNRNNSPVWTAQKETTINGPLRKLQARRSGSLVFMRGLTLVGDAPFTIEAKLEDLLGNTAGTVRTPLRTGSGAPGLMASDALCVRAFKSAADRFEADQLFNYDGEALSPVLNPVFRGDQPVNLQFFLIIYPDIYGAPPELSLELSREGQVVTRMPLQFKSPLVDISREGKFGSIGGKGTAMFGGKSREFPYLATVKGARLAPGDYTGVISIRQGRSIITRDVSFRITGSGTTNVHMSGGTKATAADSEDMTPVPLPDIEAATVESVGLTVPLDEQKRLWNEAAAGALAYSGHLPNFRCTQETHRFIAPIKTPQQLREADSMKDEVTYEDGREGYRILEVNGLPVERITRDDLKGVHSRGEFGSMLRGVFDPEVAAQHKWAGRSVNMGVLCHIFEVEVPKAKSNFSLTHNGRRESAAYSGRVFIDEETGQVRRLVIQGTDLPKDFGLQSPAFSLEYGIVRIGSDDYLLPLRSVLQLRQGKAFVRNESVFRDYRRYEASSDIRYTEK